MNSQKKFQPSKSTIVAVAAILANSPWQTDRPTPKVACWAGFPTKKSCLHSENNSGDGGGWFFVALKKEKELLCLFVL